VWHGGAASVRLTWDENTLSFFVTRSLSQAGQAMRVSDLTSSSKASRQSRHSY